MQYSFGSLFAGIGGICIGFSQENYKVEWANEIDKYACQTYRLNECKINPELTICEGDIRDFSPDTKVDVLGGGFPCQPYSIAGRREGLNDKRGKPMFDEIIRIANLIQPRIIFLENVGNLKTFDDGKTFPILIDLLKNAGYEKCYDFILNSKDYSGIAQFRKRIYIIAFRNKKDAEIFETIKDEYIKKRPIDTAFDEIIEDPSNVPIKYYYSDDDSEKCISVRYKEHFEPYVTEKGIFYQYRRNIMRRNKSGLCPALTASMGSGGHNVPIILDDRGIRKLMPDECLRIQGFPDWFSFPKNMADCHKYKQVGNSVSIPVIRQFAKLIRETLEISDKDTSENIQ